MPKNSFEDNFPWNDSNKWGVTTSPDTMKWATKAWEEGFLESKADHANLVDFNSTLESLHNKLKTQANATTQQESSTVEGPPKGGDRPPLGPAAQNRLPLDQYKVLRESGDAIADKCKVWVGSAGEERGKLGALCRRFLFMGGYTVRNHSRVRKSGRIQENPPIRGHEILNEVRSRQKAILRGNLPKGRGNGGTNTERTKGELRKMAFCATFTSGRPNPASTKN